MLVHAMQCPCLDECEALLDELHAELAETQQTLEAATVLVGGNSLCRFT